MHPLLRHRRRSPVQNNPPSQPFIQDNHREVPENSHSLTPYLCEYYIIFLTFSIYYDPLTSFLHSCQTWQSFSTASLQVIFGVLLALTHCNSCTFYPHYTKYINQDIITTLTVHCLKIHCNMITNTELSSFMWWLIDLARLSVWTLERGANDLHYGSADVTATASSPASLESRLVFMGGGSKEAVIWVSVWSTTSMQQGIFGLGNQ